MTGLDVLVIEDSLTWEGIFSFEENSTGWTIKVSFKNNVMLF